MKRIAPTEQVHLEMKDLLEDFNFEMERSKRCVKLLHGSRELLGKVDLQRMESVLYAFAMKFLPKEELEKTREVFRMTILGQMLVDEGIERGIEQGIEAFILDNLEDGKTGEQILRKLEKRFSLNAAEAKKYFDKYAPGKVV